MTLDFYVIRDQYDSALAAIDRLDQRVQDPYLNYQRGSIAFAQGEYGQIHIEHNGRDAKNQHPAHFNVTSEIQSQNPTPAGVPPSCPSPPSRRCRRRCRF